MAAHRRETLSAAHARKRLHQLGARLDRRNSTADGQLYWANRSGSWVLVRARLDGRFDLDFYKGCGC